MQSALLDAFVTMKHIPASDVAGSQPGSVYYAYDKATNTYWAMARYEPSPKDSQAVQVSFQDGGQTGFFKRVGAGPWQASFGGSICVEERFFPKATLAAWLITTTATC